MRSLIPLTLVLLLTAGCAISTQRFQDISYDSNGNITRSVTGKSRTYSPPFEGARSQGDHKLFMVEDESGWSVEMGSSNDLEGGDGKFTPEQFSSVLKVLTAIP